jgi:hypothetical protein
MAARARRRLGQAEYLLRCAEGNLPDRDAFLTYLEAFVAFGISVIHVLKEEVEKAAVWARFKPAWDALGQEPLPVYFRKMTNVILKEEGAPTARAEYAVSLAVGLIVTTGFEATFTVTRADGSIELERVDALPKAAQPEVRGQPEMPGKASARYLFANGPLKDQDVTVACHQYVTRLEQTIAAAEQCGA